MLYIYEGHLGGLYVEDYYLDFDDLYCEACGDSDTYVGQASTAEEAWELLKDNTSINGSGGWDYDYVQEFIRTHWDSETKGDFCEDTYG